MAMSWRDGLLSFERKPLGEVAAEFNRYNQVKLVVDPSATGVIVDGSFRATTVAGFLRLLKQGFGVESVPDGRTELVLTKILLSARRAYRTRKAAPSSSIKPAFFTGGTGGSTYTGQENCPPGIARQNRRAFA